MTLSSSTSKLLADLQETSSELTTTLFNLPRIGPLEDDAISVNDKTQFSQQLKKVRASLASIHQSLHNTPEWYTDGATITTTATTTDTATSLSSKPCKQAILSTALTCIVQCRGWILARALTNDLPRVLLKKLDEHITPPLDSICFMLLYGSKMGTMDRCHVAHAILDVPIDAMKDSSTIHLNGVDVQIVVALIKLQHYRLVLQNFSDLPSSVRLQLIQGSSNKQKGSKASEALTPLIDAFLAFVDQYGASLAAWTTDDALLALVLTGGSNAWTQLVVMLAFLGYQQSTETFSHWEQSVLHGILNGTSISAIIFTEAWSIVVRHYSISHLQSTISALCKLLQRTYSIIPLRDRLSNLIGR
ncbi:hypothetical protein BDF22DRAFT_99810 [Syncephalis plumigaleata]|nr:hypothetical protein BDF22DRAFT_99810 [Syncephalis plumigaleata]